MSPVGDTSSRQLSDARTGGDTQVLLRADILCQNTDCSEVGVLVMSGEVYSGNESEPEMLFTPTYVNPSPNFFELSDKYPFKIRLLLEQTFSLFWIDQASSGNRLRVAIEELLTQFGIDQYQTKNGINTLSKRGLPKPLPLQERLNRYKKRGKHEARSVQALEAVKCLGNELSHRNDRILSDIIYKAIMVFGAILENTYLSVKLPENLNFSIEAINFFYNPN